MDCCCYTLISYLWSACLAPASKLKAECCKTYKPIFYLLISKFRAQNVDLMDARKTEGSVCHTFYWYRHWQYVTIESWLWVCTGLTDACEPCWRELCSSQFPPGQARLLCPASWDFWAASSWSVDTLDEICCRDEQTSKD